MRGIVAGYRIMWLSVTCFRTGKGMCCQDQPRSSRQAAAPLLQQRSQENSVRGSGAQQCDVE